MNSDIAKQRISEVIRIDTITSSFGDFMATHVPVKQIQIQDVYNEGTAATKTYSEEQVYRKIVLNPKNQHQFVLVVGSSGAGKSHLIRWFDAKLERQKPEDEVVLFIRRSDNTLKGTIRQLLAMPEIAAIHNKDLYDRLVNATATISEDKLKNSIYHQFMVEIEGDNGEDVDYLSNVNRKRIVPLFNNELFKARMMAEDGPIDRIYVKVAENAVVDSRDIVAEFRADDFNVDVDFCDRVMREGGDRKAVGLLDKLIADPELSESIAKYLNSKVETVIQRCAGLEPGDFEQVFKDIRKELKIQGKNLTLLIEDITSFTGVNSALINALMTAHTGDYEQEQMCRISSIIGITSEYYKSNFRDNYKSRVSRFIVIPDDVFGTSEDDLCEFAGRYLNAMSLPREVVEEWAADGASAETLPVHEVREGIGWDTAVTAEGKVLNLFPFSRRAVVYMYNNCLQSNYKTPRSFLREVIEDTVRDALWNFDKFPGKKIKNTAVNTINLRQAIRGTGAGQELFDRMYLFMCVWGNATSEVYEKNGVTYIAGLSEKVYKDMGFPLINGEKVSAPANAGPALPSDSQKPDTRTAVKTPAQMQTERKKQEDLAQLNESLQVIESWVAGGTINVGATTGNVALISNAREDMCAYLYSAIDWQAEGVSMDNIDKIKKGKLRLLGFERQKRGSDQMIYMLPANRDSQDVVEAFLRWNVLGKKSWNFDGADTMLYKVQLWTEKVKKPLIQAVTTFDGMELDYFKCAMMAEFYRVILTGASKVTTLDGLKPEHILECDIEKGKDSAKGNSHSDAWNSLLDYISQNDRDKDNRNTVIQYCNLIQAGSHSQVFLDRVDFDAMVRKAKNESLVVSSEVLDKNDPVRLRRDAREYLRSILERINRVSSDERSKAKAYMTVIRDNLGTDDIDDESIEETVYKIQKFYSTAESAKMPGKYDKGLFDAVMKNAYSISAAIREMENALDKEDPLACILAFSQDPIRRVEKLIELLNKVTADIAKIKAEVASQKEKYGGHTDADSREIFENEKEALGECHRLITEMEGVVC